MSKRKVVPAFTFFERRAKAHRRTAGTPLTGCLASFQGAWQAPIYGLKFVLAGLVPAIRHLLAGEPGKDVGVGLKPGMTRRLGDEIAWVFASHPRLAQGRIASAPLKIRIAIAWRCSSSGKSLRRSKPALWRARIPSSISRSAAVP